ncbi:cbb3-type cytochrome c oxidase N-terminal domain-containing protein [Lutibacter sp. TH_r2]|uniref:cbb3-type cytochrome c oxidase N-terminal domain-containing protein n=1 Tax=Lutibacter sp. TH_r2 TaxID=3082083 RepID=UPI0029549141|nr:cbb3-type cytochrome c oxidase N-terminal domain-containing protein [Lutibacter sp. TH_r2]MDV7188414.1 cbb3-type cytochrome c oxidase N-terminal domain-containing protein [Lutibacter sp. TH_r2]
MSKKSENISGWKKFMKSMTKAHELGTEEDIMLDHDYDGIKELDNVLPPWWLYGFYITIIICVFYYIAVLGFGWWNQYDELTAELETAKIEIQAYKDANPELFDDSNIVALTDAESIAKGKELFATKTCTACHLADLGGSIGPNLTDNKWILGGGVKNIFNTLTNGGRPGKGMIAWESTISRQERIELASYIISMQGSTPAAPKAPEGDITWPE